jgi:hypothetical protein
MNLLICSDGPTIRTDHFYGVLKMRGWYGNLDLLVCGNGAPRGSWHAIRGYARYNNVPLVTGVKPETYEGDVDAVLIINSAGHSLASRKWVAWAEARGIRVYHENCGLETGLRELDKETA